MKRSLVDATAAFLYRDGLELGHWEAGREWQAPALGFPCRSRAVELHPASFVATQLRDGRKSDSGTDGLLDGGTYTSEAKGPGATPPLCTAENTQDMATISATGGGEGGYHL